MKYLILMISIITSGCVSQVLPPRVDDVDFKVDQPVYVKEHKRPVYSASLRSALMETEIFKDVKKSSQTNDEMYVAKVHRQVHGSSALPFMTFLTLGIIPTVTEEEWGESFYLQVDGRQYEIEATWKGNTMLGWLAILANLSPGRTASHPEESELFKRFLKSKIKESLQEEQKSR